MKIIQIFPGKVWGGAEQYILDLGTELQRRGHNVLYLCRNNRVVKSRLLGEFPFIELPFRCALDVQTIWRLAKLLKDADIVHVHGIMFVSIVMIAATLSKSKVKVVMTRHDAHATIFNPLFRNLFKKLHAIIFVSDMVRRRWMGANGWMPKEKCYVVINSIPKYNPACGDADDHCRGVPLWSSAPLQSSAPLKCPPANNNNVCEDLRKSLGIAAETPLIVMSGRIRRSKGCEVLLRALGTLQRLPFAMVFIGACKPNRYDEKLIRMAESLGIDDRVYFLGFRNNSRQLMLQADIGVAPSVMRDPCPLSPLEFMQAGICVITTNNGGQREYITTGETGLLVSPGDVDQLAEALERMITQPEMRKTIGRQAKAYYDKMLAYDLFVDNVLSRYK